MSSITKNRRPPCEYWCFWCLDHVQRPNFGGTSLPILVFLVFGSCAAFQIRGDLIANFGVFGVWIMCSISILGRPPCGYWCFWCLDCLEQPHIFVLLVQSWHRQARCVRGVQPSTLKSLFYLCKVDIHRRDVWEGCNRRHWNLCFIGVKSTSAGAMCERVATVDVEIFVLLV